MTLNLATPSSNKRLRDDILKITSSADSTSTDLGLYAYLRNRAWWSVSGGVWKQTYRTPTSNVVMPPASLYGFPFFTFFGGSATVNEVTTAFNYGWQLGEQIIGFSNYSSYLYNGNVGGTLSVEGVSSPNRQYAIRQIMYNVPRNEIALRASQHIQPWPSQGDLGGMVIAEYNASGSSLQSASYFGAGIAGSTLLRFGQYNVNGDVTGVWVFSGTPGIYWGMGYNGLQANRTYSVWCNFNS